MAQSASMDVRVAVVEQTLTDHIKRCDRRAARAEKWLMGVALGVLTLVGEAAIRIWWH